MVMAWQEEASRKVVGSNPGFFPAKISLIVDLEDQLEIELVIYVSVSSIMY